MLVYSEHLRNIIIKGVDHPEHRDIPLQGMHIVLAACEVLMQSQDSSTLQCNVRRCTSCRCTPNTCGTSSSRAWTTQSTGTHPCRACTLCVTAWKLPCNSCL